MKAQELKAQIDELLLVINQLNGEIKAKDLIIIELQKKLGL